MLYNFCVKGYTFVLYATAATLLSSETILQNFATRSVIGPYFNDSATSMVIGQTNDYVTKIVENKSTTRAYSPKRYGALETISRRTQHIFFFKNVTFQFLQSKRP